MGESSSGKLKSTLGFFDATAISLGAIIGSGIFVVTGIVAGLAGPALVVSMVIAAVISLFTALSFVELTAWMPLEGSVYEFAHRLVSPFAGFLSGWMWIVSNTFAGAAVSVGFAYYLVTLFPSLDFRLIAAILCVIFALLNYVGVKHSAMFNNILVSAKVLILLVFVAVGLFHVKSANFTSSIPSEMGVLRGAYFIFFAYSGFARIAVVAEEVQDARRTIPRSIILSLAISTTIYILVGAVAVGLIGAERLGESNSPLVEAISVIDNPILAYVVSLGGMFATASVLLTSILGVSRMAFAMARKRDLPSAISRLHSKYNTPYASILIIGILMALLAIFVDLAGVVAVSTFASLFYYALANVSALKLKVNTRRYPRFVPAIGLATCVMLLAFVQPSSLTTGLGCLMLGALYYVVNKKFHESPSSMTRR
jgi:APA family basic amino acid/polyamine antiporter